MTAKKAAQKSAKATGQTFSAEERAAMRARARELKEKTDGETALQAAKRELVEETGYRARRWTKLAQFFSSPGFLAEHMTIYLATSLIPGKPEPVEDERIELRWFSPAQMEQAISKGRILDAKTMVGYFTWKNRQSRAAGA